MKFAYCKNCGHIIESEICECCGTDHNIKIMTKYEFAKMINSLPPMRYDPNLKNFTTKKDFPLMRGMILKGKYCDKLLYVRIPGHG